jgi:hypothetical protein
LKDAEQEIKAIEARNAEDNMTASAANGAALDESPLDRLKNRAKSDIIIQIWWKLTKSDSGRIVSFTLDALDAYTSKRIASSTGNSMPNNKDIVPEMLMQGVSANIEPFTNQLQSHFSDLVTNGREIKIVGVIILYFSSGIM